MLLHMQGSNAELTYSISNITGLATQDGVRDIILDPFFTINSTTADLYVNTDLEREEEVDGYHYYEITVCEVTLNNVPTVFFVFSNYITSAGCSK